MSDNSKKNNGEQPKQEVKEVLVQTKKEVKEDLVQPKQEVKEVLVQTKKDTSTKATPFEERVKIEAEVTMVKIGKNAQGQSIFVRSDKITADQKKQRLEFLDDIRNKKSN